MAHKISLAEARTKTRRANDPSLRSSVSWRREKYKLQEQKQQTLFEKLFKRGGAQKKKEKEHQ